MTQAGSDRLYDATWHLRGLLDLARARGLNVDPIVREAGLSPEQILEPLSSIAFECTEKVANTLSRLTRDPFVFMNSAATQNPRDIGLLGYHALSAPSMSALLVHAFAGLREVSNVVEVEVDCQRGRFLVRPQIAPSRARGLSEALLACFVHTSRRFADPDFRPTSVKFMHPPVIDDAPYRHLFHCPLHYGHSQYELTFDPSLGCMKPVTCDPKLHAVLQPYISLVTPRTATDAEGPFHMQVRQQLTRLFTGRAPTLEKVARALGMKPRTFQHRLTQEGKRYRVLLDEARREVALASVRRSKDIADLATRLGYQDPAAFYRAFRRWTGMTPAAFRASQKPPSASTVDLDSTVPPTTAPDE